MMYEYFKHIALALVRRNGKILLIKHHSEHGQLWWLPGGKVEPGEEIVAGLQRELLEELGVQLVGTPSVACIVQILRQRKEGLQETLSFLFECEIEGEFVFEDPDGQVVGASWIDEQEALEHLSVLPWYDVEPMRRWINGQAEKGAVYVHRVNK